ncbi:hypothetical protein KY329_04210 [Candidatus Woesearchaeota archaeon]|nr:hypothetical protein [Candidatus Woesearchaeota archaeon]
MIETDLFMTDFTKYFENNHLERLEFPNGRRVTGQYVSDGTAPFAISLRELYRLATGWKINHTDIPLDEIVGVVAFGRAIAHPGYTEETRVRRKYVFFGPKVETVEKVPIQPDHADFLVVTKNDLGCTESYIAPVTTGRGRIIKGGIRVIHREIDKVPIMFATRASIPVFLGEEFNELREILETVSESPRKVYWDVDQYGDLMGRIK